MVHFSCKALGYLGVPHESILHSPGHPILKDAKSPASKRGFWKSSQNSRKRRSGTNAESSEQAGPSKTKPAAPRKRLTNAEVAKFLVDNDIKTETQLMSIAKQRQSAEEPDLFNFILNKAAKSLSELIATTWKMHNARLLWSANKNADWMLLWKPAKRVVSWGVMGDGSSVPEKC